LDWFAIHNQISMKLAKADLIPLFRAAVKAKPTLDPAQLLERLDIFVRMGDRKQADLVIQALAHTPLVQNAEIPGRITDFLLDHNEFDLARHLMDICPLATPAAPEVFVAHFEESPAFPDFDHWLSAREHLNPAYWSATYLEYRRAMGTLRPLLDARATDLRAHPQDMARLEAYLAVVHRLLRKPKIDWLPTVCHFPLAVENLEAAQQLNDWPGVAIPFLERALQLPITYDDYDWLEIRNGAIQADIRNEPKPENIRSQIRSLLAGHYQAIGESEKARKLQEELTSLEAKRQSSGFEHPSGFGQSSRFDPPVGQGGFGGASGFGQPGQPSPAANKNVYSYWLTRAADFIEHKDRDQAEQAFQKALELSRATPGDNEWNRVVVKNAYAAFLSDTEPPIPALTWLRSELDKTPIESEYAHSILETILSRTPPNSPNLRPPDETLWRYLAARKKWEYQEERILQEMISPMQPAERDAVWTRAAKLAAGNPDRGRSLAALMQRYSAEAQALPVLEDVARQTQSDADRHSVTMLNLQRAFTALDWPRMKTLWSEAQRAMNPDEYERWNQMLLGAAVHAKAYDDAMAFFTTWTHEDYNRYQGMRNGTANADYVRQLAKDGLKERLRRFYQNLALADPNSHVPQAALSILDSPAGTAIAQGRPGPSPVGSFPPSMGAPIVIRMPPPRSVSVTLTNLDLTSALQRVCDQAEISYVFALEGCTAQRVTLTLKDVPLDQAIQQILKAAAPSLPLKSVVRPWAVTVGSAPVSRPSFQAPLDPTAERLKSHVIARFRDLSVYLSLSALLDALKINYNLDMDGRSAGADHTLQFTGADIPAQDLLDRLMKKSRYPLSHWSARGVFTLGLRDNAPD